MPWRTSWNESCAEAPAGSLAASRGTIKRVAGGPISLSRRPITTDILYGLFVIILFVNGESRSLEQGATVTRLLEQLELTGKRVAVEKNGAIVPRSHYTETELADGDQLEIVVAVGGG